MSDYIERSTLIAAVMKYPGITEEAYRILLDVIKSLPAADKTKETEEKEEL